MTLKKNPALTVNMPSPVWHLFYYKQGISKDVKLDLRHTQTNDLKDDYGSDHTRWMRYFGPCKKDHNNSSDMNNVNGSIGGK